MTKFTRVLLDQGPTRFRTWWVRYSTLESATESWVRWNKPGWASHGSAHEIPHCNTRFCSIALDFGNDLCSPRVTTFADCGGETP